MWLLAPLISKLPCAVQGRVLKVAGKNKITIIVKFEINITSWFSSLCLIYFYWIKVKY